MTGPQKEEQKNSQFFEEFLEIYRQLSPWGRFQIDLYLNWMSFQRRLGKLVWDWIIFQWKINQAVLRLMKT
jgi:hypothetical protein